MPLLVTVQKVGKSAFVGKSEIDLFVVSRLRPSNYGHSGLNFRKTRVQLTVKLNPLFPVKDTKGGAKHVQLHISTVAIEL